MGKKIFIIGLNGNIPSSQEQVRLSLQAAIDLTLAKSICLVAPKPTKQELIESGSKKVQAILLDEKIEINKIQEIAEVLAEEYGIIPNCENLKKQIEETTKTFHLKEKEQINIEMIKAQINQRPWYERFNDSKTRKKQLWENPPIKKKYLKKGTRKK